eukprot:1150889-Pelagomonas_calceolata.AAC.6
MHVVRETLGLPPYIGCMHIAYATIILLPYTGICTTRGSQMPPATQDEPKLCKASQFCLNLHNSASFAAPRVALSLTASGMGAAWHLLLLSPQQSACPPPLRVLPGCSGSSS